MHDSPMNPQKRGAATYLNKHDELSKGIDSAIDRLARDGGLLTRWRLQRTRDYEAIRLNETAMVDYMAARRRILQNLIAVEEDRAKKQILANSMDQTRVIEKEIADIIAETTTDFENLIGEREEAALKKEAEQIAQVEKDIQSGDIGAKRGEQRIARIERSTDRIVGAVESTILEMLANLRQRFDQALQND